MTETMTRLSIGLLIVLILGAIFSGPAFPRDAGTPGAARSMPAQ